MIFDTAHKFYNLYSKMYFLLEHLNDKNFRGIPIYQFFSPFSKIYMIKIQMKLFNNYSQHVFNQILLIFFLFRNF